MIIVTGAGGKLGAGIVEHLLRRAPDARIGVSVRDPSKAEGLRLRGVEVRQGDFAEPESLARAFAGAEQVLIVSADKLGDEALRLHRAAITAAREAGARRVLYTSHMGVRRGSPFLPADQHAGTEADLTNAGVAATALRNGFYAESCLHMVGAGLRSGDLVTPEDGPVSWTARDDLAEGDAALLLDEESWLGATPPLTGGEAVTMAELAATASELTGREVHHTVVSDEAWKEREVAAGRPAVYADMLLGMFQAARRGDFSATDATLAQLLGRTPLSMRDVLRSAGF